MNILNLSEYEAEMFKRFVDLHQPHMELLGHIGANNVPNAKKRITRERKEFEKTKDQLKEVVNALEVDNWRNAVFRAKSLLDKLEQQSLPVWLKSISPAWVTKVTPSSYKRWLNFCREQYLVALGQLQMDVELGLDVDVEEQIAAMKEVYLTEQPGEFVEAVSRYITVSNDEEYEGDELTCGEQ